MNTFEIVVSTASGIEAVTKRELYELKGIDSPANRGRISLIGDYNTVAELNINLRTADRVLIKLAEFTAISFDELYERLLNVGFEDYITNDGRILIMAKSTKSKLYALSSIQSVTKKAIIERLKKGHNTNSISEDGATYRIEIAIYNDTVTISLDTSGDGLHKRGYRDKVYTAPLKETLAAAIIKMSIWNPKKALVDPFCGSGTIPIEAALIANNIAPCINRKFDFCNWSNFPISSYKNSLEKAKDQIIIDNTFNIKGYDIESKAISLSEYHAKRAGVEIEFEHKDMREVKSSDNYGVIISNPPYGERLLLENDLRLLYKDLFNMYENLNNWSMYILTASERFEEYAGKKSTKNRKLYNSQLQCRLYTYLGAKPPRK